MPPLIPGRAGRQVQALANPANQARALAQQQQGGVILINAADFDREFSPVDIGRVVEGTGATALTFTIPVSTDVPMPLYVVIEVFQAGTGQITIAGATGVTLDIPPGFTAQTAGQYATIGLRQRVIDEWALNGDLATG